MANTNIKRVRTSDLELKDRLVAINRVTKVTKGGRTFTFSAIVVVGNENGVVGYGLGKAAEVTVAISKGVEDAKKNLVKIPVLNGTIPHKQEMRFGGSEVMIRPAAPGTGIIAGGAMRAVLESVGIKNVLSIPLKKVHPNEKDCNADVVSYLKQSANKKTKQETTDPRWDSLKNMFKN